MAGSPARWPVWRVVIREAGRALAGRVRRIARAPWLGGPVPDRLVVAPYDLRTSDPTVAAEIGSGLFVPDPPPIGAVAEDANAPLPPDRALARYGFGWLRHLRTEDSALARENARGLIAAAIGPHRRELERGPGRDTAVVTRRIVSFLGHSPLVLAGADHAFYVAYLRAIGRGAAALDLDMTASSRPADRLIAAIGLSIAGLCCEGLERQLRRATRVLSAELDTQILPDGGHVSRNPAVIIDLLLDLLPLRSLYASRGVAPPQALELAIDRMIPALRFFRHGNGDLALFNGMGRTPVSTVATILTHDGTGGAPPVHAVESGYDRLQAAGTVAVVDTGSVPPLPAAADAHAGFLSFELSSGLDRIVVNCGAPGPSSPHRALARGTAAHSTLTLGDSPAASPLDGSAGPAGRFLLGRLGPALLPGPTAVQAARRTGRKGELRLSGQHDGYARRFGAVHARRLELAPDGGALRGSDTLTFDAHRRTGPSPPPAAVRFHLHPDVVAVPDPEGRGVLLGLASGERWLFTQSGGRLLLEDSAFFAVPEAWRQTAQIRIELGTEPGAAVASCRWEFRRQGADAPLPAPLPEPSGMVSGSTDPDLSHAP